MILLKQDNLWPIARFKNYKSGLLLYNLSKKIKKLEFSKIITSTLKLNNENAALFFKNRIISSK